MRILLSIILLLGPLCDIKAQFFTPILGGAGASVCGSPAFSPVAGTYVGTQSVTISTTLACTICYNTTGSITIVTPGTCPAGTTTYTTAVSVSSTETLYAVATSVLYPSSAQTRAAYTIQTQALVGTPVSCSGYPATCTITIINSGDTLVACAYVNVTATMTIAGDSKVGSVSYPTSTLQANSASDRCGVFITNSTGSSVVTFTNTQTTAQGAAVAEFTGTAASSPVDTTSTNSASTGTAITTGNFITTGNPDILIAFAHAQGHSPTTNGWTNAGTTGSLAITYKTSQSPGTYNGALTATSGAWEAIGFGLLP